MSWRVVALGSFLVGMASTPAPMRATTAEGSTPVTFNKDVLPILQKNCQACHRPGEIAPMSFLTYTDTRPWAKAIKVAVLSRQMPPWFADPLNCGVSKYRAARGLTVVTEQDTGLNSGRSTLSQALTRIRSGPTTSCIRLPGQVPAA